MARTQVQAELIATNAISGTIIADNAITATHIATNSISGTLVQDGGIVTTMIAANNVTAAKIVSDGVEHRHMHSNVISGLSTVTAVGGDYVLIGDTSDSNNLKKALVSDLGNDLDAAVTINESGAAVDFRVEGDTEQNLFFVDGSADKIGIGTANPQSKLQVATSNGTMSHFGGIAVTDTHYSGISLGYTEAGNTNYRKAAIVQEQIGDGAARGHMHFLVDTANDGNSAVLADSKLKIHGTSGNVGINCAASNAKLEVVATSGEVFRADANNGAFRLVANQTDVQASVMRVTAGAVSAPSYSFIGDTTTGMSRPTGSAVNFVCGGTEKARVDTNGFKITHTSNSGETAGQPDLGKTTFGGIHFESGTSGTSRGITWEASDGQTQAGYVVHNNGSDGTHHGWFATNTYSGGPYCRMKLTNYGSLVLGPAIDVGSVSPASSTAVHAHYGDILVNATSSATSLSDLLPGYSRGSYGCLKSNGAYIYFSVNGSYVSYIASNGAYSTSDARLKENVTNLTGSLDKIKQLRGVKFTWKDTETRGSESNIGFLAHEVEPHFPEIVGDGALPNPDDETAESYKNVNYAALVPALVESIKELEARIKELEG